MVFGNCSCQLLLLRNMVWLKIRLVSAQNHDFYLRSHFPFKILASNGITIKWCKMSWNCVHYELQYDHVLNHARARVTVELFWWFVNWVFSSPALIAFSLASRPGLELALIVIIIAITWSWPDLSQKILLLCSGATQTNKHNYQTNIHT